MARVSRGHPIQVMHELDNVTSQLTNHGLHLFNFLLPPQGVPLPICTSLGLVVTLQVAESSGQQNAGPSQRLLLRNFDKA